MQIHADIDDNDITAARSAELMRLVFDHYLNHHKAVFKKLHHARDATQKSYGELEKNAPTSTALPQSGTHDATWSGILEVFKDYGATEEELDAIDVILTEIPRKIKKHYDVLIEQDKVLKDLISKLHTAEYKEALSLIREVQMRTGQLSGKDGGNYGQLISSVESFRPTAFQYDSPKTQK